jgi:MFS family permease
MMEPYFGLKGGWLTFWVTVACATDMMLFGYDQGVFGGVVVTSDFLDTLQLNGKTSLIATVTAIYDIGLCPGGDGPLAVHRIGDDDLCIVLVADLHAGCFVGAIAAVVIGERLGRKKTILLGTSIMALGAILQIAAFNVPVMIVGRIIAGIGMSQLS